MGDKMGDWKSHIGGTPLSNYMIENSLDEPEVLQEIRRVTREKCGRAFIMLTDVIQAQFMRMTMKSINVKKFIEVGSFTGYNLVNIALVIPEGGVAIGCDVSQEFTDVGKEVWSKAGLGLQDKIKVHIRPAAETLDELIKNGESGTYDGAYIDADKPGYDEYYEKCVALLRPNGLIFLDNMFQAGNILAPEEERRHDTKCLMRLTKTIASDKRVDSVLLSLGDGLFMCRKI